jgi:hypothetical protein
MLENLLILNSLSKTSFYKVAYETIKHYSSDVTKYPSTYSKLFEGYVRYLEGNIIIKSKSKNLQDIIKYVEFFDYPFILLSEQDNEDYQICSDTLCFFKTSNKKELIGGINDIIKSHKSVVR